LLDWVHWKPFISALGFKILRPQISLVRQRSHASHEKMPILLKFGRSEQT
jgi:hypothetical protein